MKCDCLYDKYYSIVPLIVQVLNAAEPEQLIKELEQDEAIQEADTLLPTNPNTLGVDYNVHVLSSILNYVALELGWR